MTEVIYRRFKKGGDTIAIFPYIAEDRRGALYGCSCYQHLGQHGACDYVAVMEQSNLAGPDEYKALHAELKRQGYEDLRIIKKRSWIKAADARA